MLEEAAEGLVRAVARGLAWLAVEILFGMLFYYTGLILCRTFTLGLYPRPVDLCSWDDKITFMQMFLTIVGALFWLSLGVFLGRVLD